MPARYKRVTCSICGEEFDLSESTYQNRIKNHPIDTKFYCKKCKGIGLSLERKEFYNNLPEEERERRRKESSERAKKQWASYDDARRKEIHEIFSKGQRARIEAMTPEELDAYKKSQSEKATAENANKTEEEREAFSKHASERAKQMWENMTDKQRDSIRQKQSDGLKRYINSLSPDEKAARDKRLIDDYANLSQEKKKEINKKLSQYATERINNMSDKELSMKMDKIHAGFNKYFSDKDKVSEFSEKMKHIHSARSEESKQEYVQKMKEWYDSLSPEEKAAYNRNRLANSSGTNNSLMKKFSDMFIRSDASNSFYIISELPTVNRNNVHSWDYGIFDENGELVMVVDLDGAYYHADAFDYDGIHSREEYDIFRRKSIPNEIIPAIIQEFDFENGFNRVIDLLKLSYNEYRIKIFNECRAMPFPEPTYSDEELIKSWNRLMKMNISDKYHENFNINPRLGDRIITNFHHSMYHYCRCNLPSVHDIWKDDKLLNNSISDNVLYQSYLNRNKMLQAFIGYSECGMPKIFSAALVMMIIHRYAKNGVSIFDPFAEYSGRLLGALASGHNYTGIYNSIERYNEANDLYKFIQKYSLSKSSANIYNGELKTFAEEYQCLFTCPPPNDSYSEEMYTCRSQDDWIDICMNLFKCELYIFIVSDTKKYKNKVELTISNKYNGSTDSLIIIS